jgi:hypothetical protein
MKKRPPGRQTELSANCPVTRRGLLVAPEGCLRAASIVKLNAGPNGRGKHCCFKDRTDYEKKHKRRWACPPKPWRKRKRSGGGTFKKRPPAQKQSRWSRLLDLENSLILANGSAFVSALLDGPARKPARWPWPSTAQRLRWPGPRLHKTRCAPRRASGLCRRTDPPATGPPRRAAAVMRTPHAHLNAIPTRRGAADNHGLAHRRTRAVSI